MKVQRIQTGKANKPITVVLKKRGRKPVGGIRIILRLTPPEVKALEEKQKESGASRTELIRRAIEAAYLGKRRESDWNNTKEVRR